MERIELSVQRRSVVGKQVRRLRREGLVPAVIYGHGVEPVSIQIDRRELRRALDRAGLSHLIALHLDDGETPRMALIREVQRDALSGEILHVDFLQVQMAEKLRTTISIHLVGESPAVKQLGGMLLQGVTEVEVECLPDNLVDTIEVDISSLTELGEELTVADLPIPEGIEVLSDPQEMVVRVMAASEEEEAQAAPAEVEVVRRARREERAEEE